MKEKKKTAERNLDPLLGERLVTFHEQLRRLPRYLRSELPNMIGTAGKASLTESLDTLMRWYDTCSKREKESFWIKILACYTLPIRLGVLSRD
jgi:hypothetical protein